MITASASGAVESVGTEEKGHEEKHTERKKQSKRQAEETQKEMKEEIRRGRKKNTEQPFRRIWVRRCTTKPDQRKNLKTGQLWPNSSDTTQIRPKLPATLHECDDAAISENA